MIAFLIRWESGTLFVGNEFWWVFLGLLFTLWEAQR